MNQHAIYLGQKLYSGYADTDAQTHTPDRFLYLDH